MINVLEALFLSFIAKVIFYLPFYFLEEVSYFLIDFDQFWSVENRKFSTAF